MFFPLFSLPFWAIGLGMLYFGLRAKYSWHLLMLSPEAVVLARSLFKRNTRKSLARNKLESVEKREFYQQNYSPAYVIELIGNDKVVPLLKWYPEEEARAPVAELRSWLE